MANTFIKINHTPIRLDSIVGIRAPYRIDIDVKPKVNKKKSATGFRIVQKPKKRPYYCFDVMTEGYTFQIVPSTKCYSWNDNNKARCLVEFGQIRDLLLDLKDEKKDKNNDLSEVNKHDKEFINSEKVSQTNEEVSTTD